MTPDMTCTGLIDARFFPQGCFGDQSEIDLFWHQFHANRLRAAGEKSLLSRHVDDQVLLLRFFLSEGVGLIALVEHTDQRTEFVAKELFLEHGGSIHESVTSSKEFRRPLGRYEWNKIVRHLEKSNFWTIPSPSPLGGLDGFHCVLEARRGDNYHVVDRWCPHRNEFANLCELFVRHWENAVGRRIGLEYHLVRPWWRLW